MNHLTIEGGLNVERQDDRSPRYETLDRVRVKTTRDHHFTYDTVGAYLQAVIKPLDSLTIIPAYRVDHLSGSFSDPSKNLHYEMNDYGLISCAANLVLQVGVKSDSCQRIGHRKKLAADGEAVLG